MKPMPTTTSTIVHHGNQFESTSSTPSSSLPPYAIGGENRCIGDSNHIKNESLASSRFNGVDETNLASYYYGLACKSENTLRDTSIHQSSSYLFPSSANGLNYCMQSQANTSEEFLGAASSLVEPLFIQQPAPQPTQAVSKRASKRAKDDATSMFILYSF